MTLPAEMHDPLRIVNVSRVVSLPKAASSEATALSFEPVFKPLTLSMLYHRDGLGLRRNQEERKLQTSK
jgi:hypothetical protein